MQQKCRHLCSDFIDSVPFLRRSMLSRRKKNKIAKIDFFQGFSCTFDFLMISTRTNQGNPGFAYCTLVCLRVLLGVGLYAQLSSHLFSTSYFKSEPLLSHKVGLSIKSSAATKPRRDGRNCRIVEAPLLHSPTNLCAKFGILLVSAVQKKIFRCQKMHFYFFCMFFVFYTSIMYECSCTQTHNINQIRSFSDFLEKNIKERIFDIRQSICRDRHVRFGRAG